MCGVDSSPESRGMRWLTVICKCPEPRTVLSFHSPGPSCRTSLKLERLCSSDPCRRLLLSGSDELSRKALISSTSPGFWEASGITFFPRESVSFIQEGGVDVRDRQRPLGGAESLGC